MAASQPDDVSDGGTVTSRSSGDGGPLNSSFIANDVIDERNVAPDVRSAVLSETTATAQAKTIVSFVIDDPDSYAYGLQADEDEDDACKTEYKASRKRARYGLSWWLLIIRPAEDVEQLRTCSCYIN